MGRNARIKLWTLVLLAASLASIGVAGFRHKIERANDRVSLIMDLQEAVELCRKSGYPLEEFFRRAKEAGITAFAAGELTLPEMADRGYLEVFSGSEILGYERIAGSKLPVIRELVAKGEISPWRTYILPNSRAIYESLSSELPLRLQPLHPRFFESRGSFLIELPLPKENSLEVPLALPAHEIALLKSEGLEIVPRLSNYPGVTPAKISHSFGALGSIGRTNLVIFNGEEVLGFPDHVRETGDSLRERGIAFGQIEFAKQKGEEALASLMGNKIIRVHSITRGEMEILSPQTVRDRYLRAARERNMRALYLRPYLVASPNVNLIEYNLEYIRSLRGALEDAGFGAGTARPFPEFALGWPTLVVMGAGALAGLFLLANFFLRFRLTPALVLAILGLAIYGAALTTGFAFTMRQLVALGVACVFPTLAVACGFAGSIGNQAGWGVNGREVSSIGRAILLWLGASALSLLGGLLLAGTLTDVSFMLAVRSFLGVKVMHVIPLVLVFMLAWHYRDPYRARRPFSLSAFVRDVLGKPVCVWHLALIALLGIVGIIYVMRTGNSSALPVGALEEKMRLGLEKALVVRPRTKEFLLGHPAFLLGTTMLLMGERRIAPFILLAGTIGQISMVNTFSHLHTPIAATLLREFWGIALGGIIGVLLSLVYVAVHSRAGSLEGREKDIGRRV